MLYRSNEALELLPVEYRVPVEEFSDAMGVPLSDHDPIVVRFDFRAVPEPGIAVLLGLGFLFALGSAGMRPHES
mgnify:CR=1 FL=1